MRPTPSLPPLFGKAPRQGFINEPLLPGVTRTGSLGPELMRGVKQSEGLSHTIQPKL